MPGGAGAGAPGEGGRRGLLSAERLTISAPGLEPVQTDGDPAGWLPAEIDLEPEPVTVLVSRA